MKTNKSLTLAALLALSPAAMIGNASAAEATEATATAVDLARVNANIQQVIDSSFQPTDVIEGVTFKLNPKNANVEKLKLQAVATATAKTSPWAPNEKTIVKLNVKTNTGKPNLVNKIPATADAAIGLQTQVLPLVHLLASQAYEMTKNRQDPSHQAEIDALKVVLTQMQSVTSLTELAPQLLEMNRLLQTINSGDNDFFSNIDIQTKMVGGKVTSIELRFTKSESFFNMIFKNIFLKLDEQSIQGGLTIAAELPASQFESMKNETLAELTAIQNNEPSTIDKLKLVIRDWAEMAKGILGEINSR